MAAADAPAAGARTAACGNDACGNSNIAATSGGIHLVRIGSLPMTADQNFTDAVKPYVRGACTWA